MSEHRSKTLLEAALQYEGARVIVVLGVITLTSWIWIAAMARDMYGSMQGASAWMMTTVWDWPHILLLWLMWAVMMTAMMLPSAAPLILLYAAAARTNSEPRRSHHVYTLAAGYVAVWSAFSAIATALQRALSSALILNPMMELASSRGAAVVLAMAGLYQLTPLKRACLRACRSPLGFMMQRWRGGARGAFELGVRHGVHCLGCCWAMMLILFAGGVMNLSVIIALTAWVLIEKLAPFGEHTSIASGLALLALAAWVGFR